MADVLEFIKTLPEVFIRPNLTFADMIKLLETLPKFCMNAK